MSFYLAKAVQNLLTYSGSFSQWSKSFSLQIDNTVEFALGKNACQISDIGSRYADYIYRYITSYNSNNAYSASCYIGKDNNQNRFPLLKLHFQNVDSVTNEYNRIILNTETGAFTSYFDSKSGTASVSNAGSYWRISISAVASDSGLNGGLIWIYPANTNVFSAGPLAETQAVSGSIVLFGAQVCTSFGLFPYIETFSTAVFSGNDYVALYPEYNYELTGKKIEDRKRARSGREYVYKWGQYEGRKFDVSYVSDADKTKINSWWSGNESLLFIDGITTAVTSVRIQNDKTPISKLEKPYMNLWKGVIELETY